MPKIDDSKLQVVCEAMVAKHGRTKADAMYGIAITLSTMGTLLPHAHCFEPQDVELMKEAMCKAISFLIASINGIERFEETKADVIAVSDVYENGASSTDIESPEATPAVQGSERLQ